MLGQALRYIRVFHDLKQVEAAHQLGISKSHLSEIESGRKTPSLQLLEKYAEVFELPVSSIFFFAENARQGSSYDQARLIVAPKILRLLEFLETRLGRKSEEHKEAIPAD